MSHLLVLNKLHIINADVQARCFFHLSAYITIAFTQAV